MTEFTHNETGDKVVIKGLVELMLMADDDEVFAPGCFDSSVGQNIRFNHEKQARLVTYRINDDGRGVILVLDVED